MEVGLALKAAGFIGLIVVGIIGNLAALLLFCSLFHEQGDMQHNEFILNQLVFANLMVMMCRCIPQVLTALGIDLLFDDHACRAIIFFYRFGRGMPIALTSLLSSYQCVVITPHKPGWAWLVPGHLLHIISFFFGLNLIISICTTAIISTRSFPPNGTTPELILNLKFCTVALPSSTYYIAMIQDFAVVSLMVAVAVYVMVVLHWHHQQVQGQQGAGQKPEGASCAVLLLVSTNLVLFGLDIMLWGYAISVSHVHPPVSDTRVFFASWYSAISPVLIIATNKKLSAFIHCSFKPKAEENIPSGMETITPQVTIAQ